MGTYLSNNPKGRKNSMSAISKTKTKVTAGVKTVTEAPQRAIVHVGLGIGVGAIIDLLLEHLMWSGIADWIQSQEAIPNALYGFTIFPANFMEDGTPWMAWDDVFLLLVTIGMLILGWFKKGFLFVIGFFVGWYLSSYMGLYNALIKPVLPPEEGATA